MADGARYMRAYARQQQQQQQHTRKRPVQPLVSTSHPPSPQRNVLLGMTLRIRASADAPNAVDGEVCMRGVLPVPSWLIPHWLLRWVGPIFFAKVIPLFVRLGQHFNTAQDDTAAAPSSSPTAQAFVRRATADADGFYASAVKAGLVAEEQLRVLYAKAAAASRAATSGIAHA